MKLAVNWRSHGIDPSTSRYHKSYIMRMCKDVFEHLKQKLEIQFEIDEKRLSQAKLLHRDVLDHAAYFQERFAQNYFSDKYFFNYFLYHFVI